MKLSKKERTQTEILEAAKWIVHEKGHEAITVRYLAEITGYSYTNLYYYYKDMNALLWSLRLDMIEDMITELTSVSFTKDDPMEEIAEVFLCYSDYFFQHPNVFRFFYFYSFTQPDGDDSNQRLDQRFNSMWNTSFTRLLQEGVIQSDQLEIVAKTIIYALQGMIMLSLSSNGTTTQEDIKKELVKILNYLLSKKTK